MMNNINYMLHKRPRAILVLLACALVAIIGIIDYSTSFDISISFFYLAPIIFATWYIDLTAGITLSIMSTIIWLVTSVLAMPSQGISMWVLVLDSAIRLGLFLVSTILIAHLQRAPNRERGLARTDYLTGILNSRAFREQANIELARAKRSQRPFTIIYFELDNFKEINERFGHVRVIRCCSLLEESYPAFSASPTSLGGWVERSLLSCFRKLINKMHTV